MARAVCRIAHPGDVIVDFCSGGVRVLVTYFTNVGLNDKLALLLLMCVVNCNKCLLKFVTNCM